VEEFVKAIAERIALAVELVAALLIAFGAAEALWGLFFLPPGGTEKPFSKRRHVFVRFGVWLLFGLEFELAADIVRSAISPSWAQIGQLGAIAAIRTFLNYFLEKDVEKLAERELPHDAGAEAN